LGTSRCTSSCSTCCISRTFGRSTSGTLSLSASRAFGCPASLTLGEFALRAGGISNGRALGACAFGTIRATALLVILSRCIPTKNSPWSSRHHLVIPEKSSRHQLTSTLLPALIGIFSRKHAPEGEVSSIVAGAVWTVSSSSSHVTFATAIIAFLGSCGPRVVLSMPIISAVKETGSTPFAIPPSPRKKPVTIHPPASLLNQPTKPGGSLFWIILVIVVVAAVAYEAFQALNRFAALTRDDILNAGKRPQESQARPTSPMLL